MANRSTTYTPTGLVLALCGGVGGAKLARGLNALIEQPGQLVIAVNTGDDFEHLGLRVCPDLDSVLYALAGKNDTQRGWGRADETWNCMRALEELGAPSWFALGDKDLAVHLERTAQLQKGHTLTAVTRQFCKQFGIAAQVIPMTDDRVRSIVRTDEGDLPFQDYFVRRASQPRVHSVAFSGVDKARPNDVLMNALSNSALEAIVICPSNPQLSIDPILSLPGVLQALKETTVPIVAVSPLIGGNAIKGPAAKIMQELDLPVDSEGIAQVYRPFLNGLVIDTHDVQDADRTGVPTCLTHTLMLDAADSLRLASETLAFADSLQRTPVLAHDTESS